VVVLATGQNEVVHAQLALAAMVSLHNSKPGNIGDDDQLGYMRLPTCICIIIIVVASQ
jgi:hypothetical protein